MAKKQIIFKTTEYVFILIFLFFIGSGLVVSPFFGDVNVIDEGQFGAWLRHMLAGEYLYIDIYSAYGPIYIYPLFWLAKIFSPSVFLIRIVYMVIYVFLAIIIVKAILNEFKIPVLLQLFTISLLMIIPGFGMRQGIGLLTILFIYKSVYKANPIWCVFTGLLLSLTFLTSSDTGIFVSIILISFLLYQFIITEDFYLLLKKTILILLSAFLVLLLFFVWSSREGWFTSYITSVYTDLTVYSGIALPNGKNFPNALELIPASYSVFDWLKFLLSKEILLYWLYLLYLLSFIYFIIKIILHKITQIDLLCILITIFGFFLSTILIGRYGHFSYVLAPAVILLCYYINILLNRFNKSSYKYEKLFSGILITVIILFSLRLISLYRPHFNRVLEIPKALFSPKPSIEFLGPILISEKQSAEFKTIQTFIKNNTTAKDSVFFLNNEPIMYLLVNRDNPTVYDLPEIANTKEKRMEVLNSLIKNKPKYIIYNLNAWEVDGISNYTRLPEISLLLSQKYQKSRLNNFIIYSQNNLKY